MNKKRLFNPILMLKGAAMGIAEVIPGVSGGTIAFITGIYETLINSIKAIDKEFFQMLLKFNIKGAFVKVNGLFLTSLLIGMLGGLIFGILVINQLLINYPEVVWAFFFGLIIGSAIFLFKQVDRWRFSEIAILLVGVVVAYFITIAFPVSGSLNPLYIILSGMIAISALILPGISGSFILLLLGMYTIIFSAVKNLITAFSFDSLIIVFQFGIGALIGLAIFSRFLSWTFKNYRNQTLALLTGFMIGSLNKIWPWRIPVKWMNKEGAYINHTTNLEIEDLKLIVERNVFYVDYPTEPYLIQVIIAMFIGISLVLIIDYLSEDPI